MAAAFLRMFYTEKADITANVTIQLSKIDSALRGILLEACGQLDRRGPYLSRMMVSRIAFRKFI